MARLTPTFAVVIPTLNEEERIGTLLDALRRQTLPAAEIYVVDGGSDDYTRDVVGTNCQSLKALRLRTSERGTALQRNTGGREATAQLLVFLDADTVPTERFLQQIATSYRRLPFAVACPWFVASDGGLAGRAIYFGFNLLFWLGQGWLRTGSGVCIITTRAVFNAAGGFDESLHLGEDVEYIRRASRLGWHRHLLTPLPTSARRFAACGAWRLLGFYCRIAPLILLGRWTALQKLPYEPAPYSTGD